MNVFLSLSFHSLRPSEQSWGRPCRALGLCFGVLLPHKLRHRKGPAKKECTEIANIPKIGLRKLSSAPFDKMPWIFWTQQFLLENMNQHLGGRFLLGNYRPFLFCPCKTLGIEMREQLGASNQAKRWGKKRDLLQYTKHARRNDGEERMERVLFGPCELFLSQNCL